MTTVSDYDSAWKEALEGYFPEFMGLLWPALHVQIDWRHPPVFRDKELQALMRSAKRGRRHVDKLVSARLLDGQDSLLWIHVEIQSRNDAAFSYRMYTYHIRLHEKHPKEHLVSLAVLTDAPAQGRGSYLSYQSQFWDCSLQFIFPVVHLEDWRPLMDELIKLAPANPFAVVMLAQLEANATRADGHRLVRKTELVKRLYLWGYERDNVMALFRIIDAMLALPEALEEAFEDAVQKLEEETRMSYVTSIERVRLKRERDEGKAEGKVEGKAEGKAEGFAALLSAQITRKFGLLPDWAKVQLVAANDATLSRWAEQILDAESIEDVFK